MGIIPVAECSKKDYGLKGGSPSFPVNMALGVYLNISTLVSLEWLGCNKSQ